MELLRELKIPLLRDPAMNWAAIQPQPGGRMDFRACDDLVRRAQTLGAEVLAVFDRVPAWAAADPGSLPSAPSLPDRRHAEAFERFVRSFVERYSPRQGIRPPIHAVQFMTDIERFPSGEYACWLRRFYLAVKAADPSVIVVLGNLQTPGLAGPGPGESGDPRYFERLLAESDLAGERFPCFDVVAFASFPRQFPGREPFSDSLAFLQGAMHARGILRPVWVTAFGSDGGPDREMEQAGDIVKWAIHGRGIGIERLYLHSLRDEPPGSDSRPGQHYGLVRRGEAGEPAVRKPACRALAVLLQVIEKQPEVTARGQGFYMLTGQGEPTFALWKVDTYDPTPLFIPGWWSVQSLTGPPVIRQGNQIRLDYAPILMQRTRSPFSR